MKKLLLFILLFYVSLIAQNAGNTLIGSFNKSDFGKQNTESESKGVSSNFRVFKIADASSPNQYILEQNYPNPFNPTTKIKFSLPKESNINLVVYNMLGQSITTLYNGKLESGTHSVDFDGSRYSSGIYFYRLEADNFVQIKKMTLMK